MKKILEGKNSALKKSAVVIAVILLLVVPTMLNFGVGFSANSYLIFLMCIIMIYSIATSGLDLLFGYTGQISLGHAGFYCIGAYASALLSHPSYGLGKWLGFTVTPLVSIFLAALLAMGFGILLSLPATRLVQHFLSLLTIAFAQLVYLAASSFPGLTNGFLGIAGIPYINIYGIELDNNYKFYLFLLALITLILVVKTNIVNSRVGRCFIAVRENQLAANGCGVDIRKYKIMAFAISAFFTGVSGALYAHLVTFISPESFMYAQSVIFLTMLVFGGNGNLIGPLLGAVIITCSQEMLQAFRDYQMLIYGGLMLVSILFLPKGLYGLFQYAVHLLKDGRKGHC